MKTVADRVGVSMMTVSRAMRNQGKVSPATRRRVIDAAEKLGYRPNPLIGALMGELRRTRPSKITPDTIAFLTFHSTEDGWRSAYSPNALFSGARARAENLGFKLEPYWARAPGMSGRRFSRMLRTRGIAGVVYAPYPIGLPPESTIQLDWDSFAPVALGFSMSDPEIHRVSLDHFRSTRTAIGKLLERGYRRIGLAASSLADERLDHHWLAAYTYCQTTLPEHERIPPFMSAEPRREGFEKWVRQYQPDAILGNIGLEWLRELGDGVPDDRAYVVLSCPPNSRDFAGMCYDYHGMGAVAVDLVVEQLYHNERGIPQIPKLVMIPGKWNEGGTVLPG